MQKWEGGEGTRASGRAAGAGGRGGGGGVGGRGEGGGVRGGGKGGLRATKKAGRRMEGT